MRLTHPPRLASAAALAALTLAPVVVHADGYHARRAHAAAVQGNKNTMRDLALGGAAVAGYGLFSHNATATVLGAAGAVLAGSQYENARREQSQQSARNGYRYHRRDR